MISFTYPLYLPLLILLISALIAAFPTYLRRLVGVQRDIRRCTGGLVHVAGLVQPGTILVIAILVYTAVFSTPLILRQRAFSTFALDLGIFDQAMWLISHGDVPFITLRGLHIFGDHGSFILLLLAPLYRVLDTPATLFIVESAAIALGSIPLYWLACSRLPGCWLPLLVPFLYLLCPPLEYVNSFEFHPEALAIPFVLFAFYFGRRGYTARFALSAGLAALCKEDVALTLIAMGLYFAWRRCVRLGLTTSVLALGWFALEMLVILPYYSRVGSFYASLYGSSGSSASGVGESIAAAASAVRHLTQPIDFEYAVLLLLPFGGLSLLGGSELLIATPAVLANLLNARSTTHTIFFQYTALVVPWLAVAAIEGLGRLRGNSGLDGRVGRPTVVRDGLHVPSGVLAAVRQRAPAASAVIAYMLAAGLLSHFFFSPSPLSFQFLRNESMTSAGYEDRAPLRRFFSTTGHDASARQALALIPPDASVAAQSVYTPHLTHRKQVYQLLLPFSNAMQGDSPLSVWGVPGQSPPDVTVDYILLDLKRTMEPMDEGEGLKLMLHLRGDRDYRLAMDKDGVMLFRKETRSP